MARLDPGAVEAFERDARRMYFSKDTVGRFLEGATPTQLAAVRGLLRSEMAAREESKRRRLLRKARFPVVKSFSDFDYANVAFPEGYGKDALESMGFLDLAQDFVFYGKSGRGKTHLAIALGMRCVEMGREARFFSTAALVRQLSGAHEKGTLDAMLADIGRADLVILDEFGYIPLDIDGARLLFQVMALCYEKRSMVITTNIEFGKWGSVFADAKLAGAAVDRIFHHGRLVEFNGPSRRMDDALMLGKGEEACDGR